MQSFLEETLQSLKKNHPLIEDLILILPSRRAGGFLKNYLLQSAEFTSFSPKIVSIEEFIEELSGLQIIDSIELLFKSYEAYKRCTYFTQKEDFEAYSTWATTLLNDFNEIDRYLIDSKTFFDYLSSIKTLEKWNSEQEQTKLIENYLEFWKQLPQFYEILKDLLLKEGYGYQGLVYRKAAEDIEHYTSRENLQEHVFIGFNALNNAEQHIIQELLEANHASIYWDMDAFFIEDPKHSASYFIRHYMKEWKHFKKRSSFGSLNNFSNEKKLMFAEVQKNIGQVKFVGSLLSTYSQKDLDKTAIVLADENLLIPILNSLPQNVTDVNITMGVPLKSFPGTIFFETLLNIHLKPTTSLYFKDLLSVLNHPLASYILNRTQDIISKIIAQNSTHISLTQLEKLAGPDNTDAIQLLFGDWGDHSNSALQSCQKLMLLAKIHQELKILDRIVLFNLYTIFQKIEALNTKFSHINSIKAVHVLFVELVSTTSMDLEGDAYSGLQIMGVLETRVLDFENIIMLSVNEGILPSGKSNSSFITYDLKKQFELPLYHDKDAVYTYHFYRLLQRARTAVLCYNSHSEGLNSGEKSRFLLQLEIEKQPSHTIETVIVNPAAHVIPTTLKTIPKTREMMERIRELSEKGFSPSSLTNYIRNPMDFYYEKVLHIDAYQEIEETVAYNTLGTIVHETLQVFYEAFEDEYLTIDLLNELKPKIEKEVSRQFKRTYKEGDISKGENLIIFEVAKRYISNFISYEINEIKAGNQIKILKIESELKVDIPCDDCNFPLTIKGKVDRVDEFNGVVRIIDYKTGLVKQGDLEIVDWNLITQDYKYSKAIQVLCYALMIQNEMNLREVEAGIISFKNLNNGFLKFGTKEKSGSRNKEHTVTSETLSKFVVELKKLILEICDPKIPFTEKEIN